MDGEKVVMMAVRMAAQSVVMKVARSDVHWVEMKVA